MSRRSTSSRACTTTATTTWASPALSPILPNEEIGPVLEYMGQTGLDAQKGADILRTALDGYTSTVTYPDTQIGNSLKGIAQVKLADLGTRVFYCQHDSFDTHANQLHVHSKLWRDVSRGGLGVLPGSARPRRSRRRHHAALVRVRAAGQGQRLRHRPRRRRNVVPDRRVDQGRLLRRAAVAPRERPDRSATFSTTTTSARPTARSWSAGSRSRRSRSCAAASSSSPSSKPRPSAPCPLSRKQERGSRQAVLPSPAKRGRGRGRGPHAGRDHERRGRFADTLLTQPRAACPEHDRLQQPGRRRAGTGRAPVRAQSHEHEPRADGLPARHRLHGRRGVHRRPDELRHRRGPDRLADVDRD